MNPMTALDAHPNGCGCAHAEPIGLERTRYYARQLVGPDELTQDQIWVRDKLRRHNRLLHGWGVVCGCAVRHASDPAGNPLPWTVIVEPGDVLGPYGDEIIVGAPASFDLRGASAGATDCPGPADPWCADVRVERKPAQQLYLAIRYDEEPTRPVRSPGGCGCGCDEQSCEYSRTRESFALAVLDELPEAYRSMADPETKTAEGLAGAVSCAPEFARAVRPCPPCPTDPWVILADIVADADGRLTIDLSSHRRYVASFGAYWFSCGPAKQGVQPMSAPQRTTVVERLDESAVRWLEERHGGSLFAVPQMEASALKAVSGTPAISRALAGRTIAEIAGTSRDDFVADVAKKGIHAKRAQRIWTAASTLIEAIEDYRAEG